MLIDVNALMTGTVLSAPGAGELFAELVRRRRLGEVRRELTLVRVPVAGRADARRVGDESRLTRVDRAVPTRGLVVVVVALGIPCLRRPGEPDRLTGFDCE